MASFSSSFSSSLDWKLAMLSLGLLSSSARQNQRRRRWRCIPNKYFTKPGIFLVLGVFLLVALPHWAVARPVDDKVDAENVSNKKIHVYAHSSDDDDDSSPGLLASSSGHGSSLDSTNNNNDEDEITFAAREDSSRFEFRRKIPTSSSSNEPDAYDKIKYGSSSASSSGNEDDKIVHSLEVIQSRSKNDNKNKDDSLLGGNNSSMIVHVIVTSSSSSTSGGSVELDETDNNNSSQDNNNNSNSPEEEQDHFQYTVSGDDDDDEEGIVAEPSSDSHVSTVKTTTLVVNDHQQDLRQKASGDNKDSGSPPKPPFRSPDDDNFDDAPGVVDNDEKLELKKLPKPENDSLDIFSAFYRAFSQTSATSPSSSADIVQSSLSQAALPIPAQPDKTSSFPGSPTADETVTTFRLPTRSDFRQRPSSFQLFQQRRRLYRNRQLAERKSSTLSSSSSSPPPKVMSEKSVYDSYTERVSGLGNASVEDTARKLEFLAKKLDKSEQDESFRGQQDKILAVSSSSSSSLITTTTTQVPFLLSQPSLPSSFFSPPKIAVSVTHTKSVVASASATTAAARRREESLLEPTKQKVVGGGVKNNAKSETTTFPGVSQQEREKIHGTYSYFSRPRPLIKSLPRIEDGDQQNDNINNKNVSNNHIFPRNFSTHGREEDSGILRKTYGSGGDSAEGSKSSTLANGNGKSSTGGGERNTRNSGSNNHNDKVNEDNFRIQDRFNIISFPRDGSESTSDLLKTSTFALSSSQPPSSLPSAQQSKKITRTVSSEIGDPSTLFFNANLNYRSTPRSSSSKVPVVQKTEQTTQQSTPKPAMTNWQQPGKVWSEPAQVWGVPAKVWGEPARVWSEPARVWSQPGKNWAKKFQDEMMQSDQPQPPEETKAEKNEDDVPSEGTFVILGDDENEEDSIDGDLGRPLMFHHFTVPPNKQQKETVSVSTSVSSSVSSNNKNNDHTNNNSSLILDTFPFSKSQLANSQSSIPQNNGDNVNSPSAFTDSGSNSRVVLSNSNINTSNFNNSDNSDQQAQNKKSGKKFGYVIEGANVRKYRVEERTPDGYIVGEYGVLNNQNAFLRGVRYTADGTINPRLIHEALMKFLSLRR